MEPGEDACHRNVMIDGKVYRTVSDKCWDAPRRLADMPAMGLEVQVLSPMPQLLSYWIPAHAANDLLRFINDQIAEMVSQSGGRMLGLGAVPLQEMDLALAELERLLAMGFAGVEIGSNINGLPIGAPALDLFFAEAARLGAAVFVHALNPTGAERLVGPKQLHQTLGYPTEIGLAAASAITSNLVMRHPTLRIGFSHGGGTLAMLLPRLEEGRKVFRPLSEAIPTPALEQARRMYYDALVYDEATLRHLLHLFGPERLMVGTDYPFAFHERHPVDRVSAAVDDEAVRMRILYENARAFLGLGRDLG